MAKRPVRVAVAAAVGFLLQAAFQAAIALGAPLGSASWAEPTKGNSPWVSGSQAASLWACTYSSR